MEFFDTPLELCFVLLVANFWSKRFSQIHCPLALKIGTRHADFAEGVCFACLSHSVGGILCIFSLLGAVSLLYKDIFSVAKIEKTFWLLWMLLCSVYAFFNMSWEIY